MLDIEDCFRRLIKVHYLRFIEFHYTKCIQVLYLGMLHILNFLGMRLNYTHMNC
jgi:hypothetical protein